jgi:hypothetical protein
LTNVAHCANDRAESRRSLNALTAELRKHILIAAEVIAAAQAGDADALADAQARWSANAHDIAVLLNSVNPRNWPLTCSTPRW